MSITLAQMRLQVRKMSARYTSVQMQDSQIDTYINNFMTLMLPVHFKNIKLTKPYVFYTAPNVDTYNFPYEVNPTQQSPTSEGFQTAVASPGNIQITPPVYCQGYILRYYQDKTTFYNRWPNLSVNQIINTGFGMSGHQYFGTIPSTPFLRGQLDIFGNVTEPMVVISAYDSSGDTTSGFNYVITDQPFAGFDEGNLLEQDGTEVGTVNYITGEYEFTPSVTAIPTSANIYAAVVPFQGSRPTDVLFYNQQIVFRPAPLQVFQVEFQISQQPLALLSDGSAPELDEWYMFICAGATDLIYVDFPDEDGQKRNDEVLAKHLLLSQRRTLRQLSSQRAQTIFSQPGRPVATWFNGTEYSGTSG